MIRARRHATVLRADPTRVINRLFLPGQEMLASGISRADAVIQRVLALTDAQVQANLAVIVEQFGDRHRDLHASFAEHFALVAHRMPAGDLDPNRQQLLGAYFTQEYAVEAAALFNPSIVPHPDQSGLAEGDLRFVMSVRAVGEGHVSSVEFRTGVLRGGGRIELDRPSPLLDTGRTAPTRMTRDALRAALTGHQEADRAGHLLSLLPDEFDATELEAAFGSVARDRLTRRSSERIIETIRWIVACHYRVTFAPEFPLSSQVLFPVGPDESNGIEDLRLTRFAHPVTDPVTAADNCYYGTYTAYDGSHIGLHLLQTSDFRAFQSSQLIGAAATNKGMALFPRLIDGRFTALTRWDRENIGVASSADGHTWAEASTIAVPTQAWELIQLGNCGSPIETDEGWLVLTHGVGAVRQYCIGAMLLDLDDPTTVRGVLTQPLLTPQDDERDGYVPNVIYSCGGLVHDGTLVLPYGCSDSAIRFASFELAELLAELLASPPGSA